MASSSLCIGPRSGAPRKKSGGDSFEDMLSAAGPYISSIAANLRGAVAGDARTIEDPLASAVKVGVVSFTRDVHGLNGEASVREFLNSRAVASSVASAERQDPLVFIHSPVRATLPPMEDDVASASPKRSRAVDWLPIAT